MSRTGSFPIKKDLKAGWLCRAASSWDKLGRWCKTQWYKRLCAVSKQHFAVRKFICFEIRLSISLNGQHLKVKYPSNFKLPHVNYVNDKNRFSDKMYADVFQGHQRTSDVYTAWSDLVVSRKSEPNEELTGVKEIRTPKVTLFRLNFHKPVPFLGEILNQITERNYFW